jgi:ATP-dependent DNA helicase
LERSAVYTNILHDGMQEDKKKLIAAQQAKNAKADKTTKGRKRGRAYHKDDDTAQTKRLKSAKGEPIPAGSEEHLIFEQPVLVTGAPS